MAKVIDTQTVRERLGDIINQAHYRGDEFLVERRGKPLIAIIPYHTYEQLQRQRAESFKVFDDIHAANADVDVDELAENVRQALAEVREERRSRSKS
jgi:prevent-host-death family protein